MGLLFVIISDYIVFVINTGSNVTLLGLISHRSGDGVKEQAQSERLWELTYLAKSIYSTILVKYLLNMCKDVSVLAFQNLVVRYTFQHKFVSLFICNLYRNTFHIFSRHNIK